METRVFGKTPEGEEALLFTLQNKNGMKTEITNFGAVVVSLYVPDENGNVHDVVLGFDNLESYVAKGPFFGCAVGRHANRIEDACFELNGREYTLLKNDGRNHLHGGAMGFDKVLWKVVDSSQNSLKLFYKSVDGEEGYPGNLDVTLTYTLNDKNELIMDYKAVSDADTVVNLTNHSYFNLSGHGSGEILNHQLKIKAEEYTLANHECLTTGEIQCVADTPMDFRELKAIGDGIQADNEQIRFGKGYDHNFILCVNGMDPEWIAQLYDPASGRKMDVFTTKPGVQLYTGNNLNETIVGKDGVRYKKWGGLCLETQFYPNAMKHKHFPSPILKAGALYHYTTIYQFSW